MNSIVWSFHTNLPEPLRRILTALFFCSGALKNVIGDDYITAILEVSMLLKSYLAAASARVSTQSEREGNSQTQLGLDFSGHR
jgi:hypothetical protein